LLVRERLRGRCPASRSCLRNTHLGVGDLAALVRHFVSASRARSSFTVNSVCFPSPVGFCANLLVAAYRLALSDRFAVTGSLAVEIRFPPDALPDLGPSACRFGLSDVSLGDTRGGEAEGTRKARLVHSFQKQWRMSKMKSIISDITISL
jgi:hypothetical protein